MDGPPTRPQGLRFGKHLCGSKHLFRAGSPPTWGRKSSLCDGEGVRNDANNASLMTLGRPAALAAGEAGAELCLPTEGIQSLSAQSCRKATGASQQRACPSARRRNPLPPRTAGSGRRGQAGRAGGAEAPGAGW